MRLSMKTLAGLAAIGAATGCFDLGGGGGGGCNAPPNGLAGKASFTYSCASTADPECDKTEILSWSDPPPLPAAVARGAKFGILFDGGLVAPVSSSAVRRSGSYLVAQRPGPVGFLGGEEAGEVIDVQRLQVVEADAVSLTRADAAMFEDPRAMSVGASTTWQVRAMRQGRPVAGALPATFTVDDPSVLEVSSFAAGVASVVALAPGETALRVSFGELGVAESIRVSGTPVSDAGSDAEAPDAEPGDADTDGGDASDAGGDQ
jgi:hypothetical protein